MNTSPNTRRRAAVALLVLAGGAFAFDRLVLPPGETPGAAAGLLVASTKKVEPAAPLATLASRLAGLRGDEGDVTVLPSEWLPAARVDAGAVGGGAVEAETPRAAAPEFRLTAVVRDRSGAAVGAWMNGRLVPVGGTVEGHRLREVGRDPGRGNAVTAVLEGAGGEVRVPLTPRGDLPDGRSRGVVRWAAVGSSS